MECIRCYCPNDSHRRFCCQCGHALVSICSRCGFFNRVTDRFCGGCGDALFGQAENSSSSENVPTRWAPFSPVPVPTGAKTVPSASPAGFPPFTDSRAPTPQQKSPSPVGSSSAIDPDPATNQASASRPANSAPANATKQSARESEIQISEDDLQELLSPPTQVTPSLPSKVSQEDIDKLFGG